MALLHRADMARKSFTLQKLSAEYGSYVQYPSGTGAASVGLAVRTDDDSRLKSEGLLVAPTLSTPVRAGSLLPYLSFFSAEVSDYDEIILTWDAPLNDLSLAPTSSTVVATSLVLSYSEYGEPPTVSDGTIISSDATSNIYYHKVPSGKWAYYTMFVKFESQDGDLYYEPTAKLAVLTPSNYKSVDDLYKKIPEYYRLLDDNMSTGLGGPLYRYLSIFGFEIDKMRTALDFMISMKDPQLANSEVLDYLAQDLGVDLQSHELGAGRLRNLMNIIGYLRRSEGTTGSLEYAMQAITGSDIEIDTTNKVVKVFAQRVNLLKDANLSRIIVSLFDGGSPSVSAFSLELDAGVPSSSGTATPVSGTYTISYEGGTPSYAPGAATGNELWTYDPDLTSGGSINILQTISNYVPITLDDELYFSVQTGIASPAQNSITKVALYANAPYGSTSSLPVNAVQSTTPINIAGINYWKLSILDQRINLCTNPSFESDTTTWSGVNATNVRTAGTITNGIGSWSLVSTHTTTSSGGPVFGLFNINANTSYTAAIQCLRLTGTRSYRIAFDWYTSSAYISTSAGTAKTCDSSSRLTVTATAPETATRAYITIYSTVDGAIGDSIKIDAAIIEASSVVGDYFDGSIASYASWSGTAHASTSIGGPSVGTYQNMYFTVFQKSEVNAQETFKYMLLERAANGQYFDGNTSFGGWLVDGNTISDYRWYNPAAPNGASPGLAIENFSVYNSNYQKTRAVASRFLTNLLPVTQLTTGTDPVYSNGTVPNPEWSITFNHIPGVTYP